MARLHIWIGTGVLAGATAVAAWSLGAMDYPLEVSRYTINLTETPESRPRYPVRVELPQTIPVTNASAAAERDMPEPKALAGDAGLQPPVAIALTGKGGAQTSADGSSLLKVDFDIATYGRVAPSGETGLRDSKAVILDGARLGQVDLSLGQGSVVSVDRRGLAELVRKRDPQLSAALEEIAGERITLDALRDRRVRVRYDPISDALLIETAS